MLAELADNHSLPQRQYYFSELELKQRIYLSLLQIKTKSIQFTLHKGQYLVRAHHYLIIISLVVVYQHFHLVKHELEKLRFLPKIHLASGQIILQLLESQIVRANILGLLVNYSCHLVIKIPPFLRRNLLAFSLPDSLNDFMKDQASSLQTHYISEVLIKILKFINLINMIGRTDKDHITVKDVPAELFIKAFAEHLKKNSKITLLENDAFIKTGISKEVSPQSEDWSYIRTAAIARMIYLKPGSGVGRLRHIYGASQRAGQGKNHHQPGSGKIIRFALQNLEQANILMKYNDKRNKNASKEIVANVEHSFPRVITFEGQKLMNNIAKAVFATL